MVSRNSTLNPQPSTLVMRQVEPSQGNAPILEATVDKAVLTDKGEDWIPKIATLRSDVIHLLTYERDVCGVIYPLTYV
jgi:hypothetical protein